MTESLRARYSELQDVIAAAEFPELDLALRRGKHIDRDDFALFTLLLEAQDHLEAFYHRFGCELVYKTDGYFYLLPTGDKLSRRQLTPGDMLVGQALALLYLDPSTIERGGRITQEDVVAQLVVVLGSDTLVHAFNPKQKRKLDERIAQKNVRARIGEGIRHLAALGFVDVAEDDSLHLRPSLLRFAEPVRGLSEPAEALAKLVAEGEVALVIDPPEPRGDDHDSDAGEHDPHEDEHDHDPHDDEHDHDPHDDEHGPRADDEPKPHTDVPNAVSTAQAFASLLSGPIPGPAPGPTRDDGPDDDPDDVPDDDPADDHDRDHDHDRDDDHDVASGDLDEDS